MGVYRRKDKLWIRYKDADGKWRDAFSGFMVGQEQLAQQAHDEVVERIAADRGTPPPTPAPELGTVRAFVEEWLPKRRERGLDWKVDKSRLQLHVLPFIGDLPLAEVRARHLVDMFHKLRIDRERDLAPRSIHHVYSIVKALFRDAKLADLINESPCVLDERQLGHVQDRDPEWRDGALFSRSEVEQIISDPRIPADRRVVYALELLAGVRTGEGAACRWRHYDPTIKPLGKLIVARSYNSVRGEEKGTKTDSVKHIPVHPTLAAILAEWKLAGWEAMMGRAPGPDDLIVPLPPEAAARRRTRRGEAFRPHDYSGKRWREHDLPTLGWRHRRHYDMRATFITLAIEDGADPEIIETRVTHTKRPRNSLGGYNRGVHLNRGQYWERTCSEVAKLQIASAE